MYSMRHILHNYTCHWIGSALFTGGYLNAVAKASQAHYLRTILFFSLFRQIQNSFVDMECMFDLLGEEPEVRDIPGALPIEVTKGQVEFRNVTFSYVPGRVVLKNLSLVVATGKTIALVSDSNISFISCFFILFYFF